MILIIFIILIVIVVIRKSGKANNTSSYNFVSPADLVKREKEKEKAQREAARILQQQQREKEKQIKLENEKQQAVEDIPYLKNQLDRYYEMINACQIDLKLARQRVQYDNDMNKYGAVISEKVVNKHVADRNKLLQKISKLEGQIHAAEKNLNKAQQIINKGI